MPETFRDIYDNISQLLHQVGNSRHFHILFLLFSVLPINICRILLQNAGGGGLADV